MEITDEQLKSFAAELRGIIDRADNLVNGLEDMMGDALIIRRDADRLRDELAQIARQGEAGPSLPPPERPSPRPGPASGQ